GFVLQFENIGSAAFEHRKRRGQSAVVAIRPGLAIDGPEDPLAEAERTDHGASGVIESGGDQLGCLPRVEDEAQSRGVLKVRLRDTRSAQRSGIERAGT